MYLDRLVRTLSVMESLVSARLDYSAAALESIPTYLRHHHYIPITTTTNITFTYRTPTDELTYLGTLRLTLDKSLCCVVLILLFHQRLNVLIYLFHPFSFIASRFITYVVYCQLNLIRRRVWELRMDAPYNSSWVAVH